jgi:hypothetical protein
MLLGARLALPKGLSISGAPDLLHGVPQQSAVFLQNPGGCPQDPAEPQLPPKTPRCFFLWIPAVPPIDRCVAGRELRNSVLSRWDVPGVLGSVYRPGLGS